MHTIVVQCSPGGGLMSLFVSFIALFNQSGDMVTKSPETQTSIL